MQCDYLLEFVATVDSGSMAKASTRIGLSQSSLSRHIKALETELGMQLVRRSASGVELTTEGRRIYSMASPIMEAVANIEAYADAHRSTKTITVCGLSDYPGLSLQLMDSYAKLGRKDPLRTAHLDSLQAPSPCEALRSGEVSLWVTYSNDPLLPGDDPDLEIVELFHPRMVAIMEASNPLAAKDRLVAADLDGQVFYKTESSYMRANTSWNATKALFASRGLRYRTLTGAFEHESDWFIDFELGILPMAEGNRSIDLLRSFGKAVLPVEDLAFTFVGAYRQGDLVVKRLVEECKEKEKDGERTESLSAKS